MQKNDRITIYNRVIALSREAVIYLDACLPPQAQIEYDSLHNLYLKIGELLDEAGVLSMSIQVPLTELFDLKNKYKQLPSFPDKTSLPIGSTDDPISFNRSLAYIQLIQKLS